MGFAPFSCADEESVWSASVGVVGDKAAVERGIAEKVDSSRNWERAGDVGAFDVLAALMYRERVDAGRLKHRSRGQF
jgi:hypothetical protein